MSSSTFAWTISLTLLLVVAGCSSAAPRLPAVAPEQFSWDQRIRAGDKDVTLDAMLDAAANADYVLVGETHLDARTHEMELAILEGLAKRKPGKVVLSLEMFQRDVQSTLDGYLAGTIDEAAFLEKSRPWGNYRTAYRPLIEAAKAQEIPVVASNLPREVQRSFAMKGPDAKLTDEQRAWVPAEILPPAQSYWKRLSEQLRDHGHGSVQTDDPKAQTYSTQNLWDNTMADACVTAHEPGTTIVHMAGAFHIEYGDGTAHQIREREPAAQIVTISIVPTGDLGDLGDLDDTGAADYLVYVPARARGPQAGSLAVTVAAQLEFKVHATAGSQQRPLLVWLDDNATATADALLYWKIALGDTAVVVAVQPPYPVEQPDLRVTGRWAWPRSYSEDQGRLIVGVHRIVDYVASRYPVDPKRVAIAGRGAGGSVALWTGLHGDAKDYSIVAVNPDEPRRLEEASVADAKPVSGAFVIAASEESRAQISSTLHAAGVESIAGEPADGSMYRQAEIRIREALGLEAEWEAGNAVKRRPPPVGVGQQWAALHARLAANAGQNWQFDDKGEPIAVTAEDFADGEALPTAPGPFGGTTILVLEPKEPNAKAWRELAEKDVIKSRSRFASVKVVSDKELGPLLEDLREKGKRSMLIVPATFAATPERIRAIAELAEPHGADLDLDYLPGLGGELARARARP